MKVPCCRVYCVGEVSQWGRQFLTALQSANVVEVSYESVQQFAAGLAVPTRPVIVFIENTTDARKSIEKLRLCGRHFFLVWFGKGFTKEELAFALEMRVYCVFEHARPEDKRIHESIRKVADNLTVAEQYEHLIHSLKSLLLQAESDDGAKPLIMEIKTAVLKLEKCGQTNELHATKAEPQSSPGEEAHTPFHKTQDFGDALHTVADLERTGALFVRGALPGQEGRVEFIQGKIVSAKAGEVRGIKAIYRMFLWDEPRFLFSRKAPNECEVDEPLKESLKYLCLEGEQLRRRFEKIRRDLPPPDLRLGLEPNSLHSGCRLDQVEFSTLASVVEFGRVSQVVDYNSLPDVDLYECLIRLKKQNMIRVTLE